MDATSLILAFKAKGSTMDATSLMRVDTTPLEEVLLNISQTLRSHEAFVSKLPQVESAQCDLRKDLNRLRLAVDSVVNSIDNINGITTDSADEYKACDSAELVREERHQSIVVANVNKSSSYGVRTSEIEPIHLKHASDLSSANAKSIREIKSTVRRLQQDRDDALVNSMEFEENIKALKETLFEVQQNLASSASIEQMQIFQQSLIAKHGHLERHLQDLKTNFQEEVDGSIGSLRKENNWFKDLGASVKQRQAKLEQRVASCARENDVAAFRDNVESDVESLLRKTSFLDDTAKAQGKALVELQHKNAIAMFHRHYTNWKRNALKTGLSRWNQVVKKQAQYEEGKTSQKRLMRKLLTNIMSRRKRFGFERWIRYRDWHRKMERQKLRATTLICERLGLYLSAPKTVAFNRWRRLTLMGRMKSTRGLNAGEEEISEYGWHRSALVDTLRSRGEADGEGEPKSESMQCKPRESAVGLHNILDLFENDVLGATHALAQEIHQIKSDDIASLRHDMCAENKKMMSTIRTTMDEAIVRVEDAATTFQETVNERVDDCTGDMPMLHSKLKELATQFENSRVELERIEESHKRQIDIISDQEQQLDQRLSAVEEQAKTAVRQITSMSKEQEKSNESIKYLRDVIAKNEERHEKERLNFQDALNHFGDELLKTKVTLGQTQVRCESLEKDLAETKLELVHFQNACQSDNDRVQRRIDNPGLPKPSLDRIVNVGHAYETLAKEKNYVTGINVMAKLRVTTTTKLKRCGEKTKHEEEVDVPSEIVAFAHDYAAWVAYQADHETLLRLVAGANPEEQVYAEDDMNTRKIELCDELKEELGSLLEKASSYPTVADDAESSSTRGLGLRWEARAIFLARVADATSAALSKHDQIILPASTRLGRVRPLSANVTVCVACDRPMRRKGNRNQSAKPKADEEKNGKPETNLDGSSDTKGHIQLNRTELRPQSAITATGKIGELLGGDNAAYQIPRSHSTGQAASIKATRLAESLKEKEAVYGPNFAPAVVGRSESRCPG